MAGVQGCVCIVPFRGYPGLSGDGADSAARVHMPGARPLTSHVRPAPLAPLALAVALTSRPLPMGLQGAGLRGSYNDRTTGDRSLSFHLSSRCVLTQFHLGML